MEMRLLILTESSEKEFVLVGGQKGDPDPFGKQSKTKMVCITVDQKTQAKYILRSKVCKIKRFIY